MIPALLLLLACHGTTPLPSQPNFLVIDIDTLRADRIEKTRGMRAVAPNLRDLAHDNIQFTQAIAPAGWTLPSLTSLLSGQDAVPMEIVADSLPWVITGAHTVPEILSYYGYQTTVFWGGTLSTVTPALNKGFADIHRFYPPTPPGPSDDVAKWLKSAPEPFFAFVHDIDLHSPIPEVPTEEIHRYTSASAVCERMLISDVAAKLTPSLGEAKARAHAVAHYDATLHWYDQRIGDIIDALQETGLSKRTVFIVTSDHGEDLYDHEKLDHGSNWDVVLRVPLIVSDPSRASRRVDTQVSTVDLAPTLLEMAHVPVDPRMEGRSLVPLLGGPGSYTERELYSLSNAATASLRTPQYKLLTRTINGQRTVELYDLSKDPDEQTNLFQKEPQRAQEMFVKLENWRANQAILLRGADWQPVSDPLRNALQRQGYWGLVNPNQPMISGQIP